MGENWLKRQVRLVGAEVATWPAWTRNVIGHEQRRTGGPPMGNATHSLMFVIEGERLCCACAADEARISGMPELFFATNRPMTLPVNQHCDRCLQRAERPAAAKAAEWITRVVKGRG